jgi:hypothetical protein
LGKLCAAKFIDERIAAQLFAASYLLKPESRFEKKF